MRLMILAVFACLYLPGAVAARPILKDSQKSYALVCLEDTETPQRLVGICETALAELMQLNRDYRNMQVVLAGAYADLGQSDVAINILEKVLSDDKTHNGALNTLGWVYWDTSDYDASIDAFQSALDVGALAESFAGLASSSRYKGEIEEEDYLTLIDTAIAMSPEYVWAYRDKAWYFIETGRPKKAEKILKVALQYDKEDPWTLYALGVAFYDQNASAAAAARLNKAIETQQAPTNAYLYRAKANFDLENYRRALLDAEHVVQDWPASPEGYVWKARSLSALGMRPAGQTVLRDYLEESYDSYAVYWLAELLYYGGEEVEAIRVLQSNFDQGDADYYDHEFMAMMMLEVQDFDAARTHIDAALKLDPGAQFPRFYTSLIHVAEGRFDEAEALFLDALRGGLPRHRIGYFIGALTEEGELQRAVEFRTKTNLVSAEAD